MPQIRAFHMAWFSFFLCFFAWFGIAPLMAVVRDELQLTKAQIGWCVTASVAVTVVARIVVGRLCDWVGPRRSYTGLLIVGSIPVMLLGTAHDPWTFIGLRLLIGVIGASFVITQYHTAVMFAPNVVGAATATAAGWGNLGGGAAQAAMPLLYGGLVAGIGLSPGWSWRLSMVLVGAACFLCGIAYYVLTQDGPQDGMSPSTSANRSPSASTSTRDAVATVCGDYRVWLLFLAYGACFGIELTVNNVIALYLVDHFSVFRDRGLQALAQVGLVAALFGGTNLFARTLGGSMGDVFGSRWGLPGRVSWLSIALLVEGMVLMWFSQVHLFAAAVPALFLLGVFVQMAEGATFAIVPFLHRTHLGSVAGIVGAGGNLAAIAAGLLFAGSIAWPTAFLLLGMAVTFIALLVPAIRFSAEARDDSADSRSLTTGPYEHLADSSRPRFV